MRRVVQWIPPVKPSLVQAEHMPALDQKMLMMIEKKERELRKTINKLRTAAKQPPRRRNEMPKAFRAAIEKKLTARSGFVDRVRVKAYAGRGGDGCVAFARGPNVRVAPASGGDAGKGGSVYLEVDERLGSLTGIARQLRAGHGQKGGTNLKTGADGVDCVVKVPRGTLVSSIVAVNEAALTDDQYDDSEREVSLRAKSKNVKLEQLADLDKQGERFCLAVGGKGGRGNAAFQTAVNRSPREATLGTQPTTALVLLELKSIADVGLVGFPNAGKSSLLYTVSRASPKVASYPFTTLHPSVGVVQFSDYSSLTMCDIPGLIEGAHRNVGLGHEFLRHIERTHVLAFVLDLGNADQDPVECYRVLTAELDHYNAQMRRKKRCVIVGNKMDLALAEKNLQRVREMAAPDGTPVFPISAHKKTGINDLLLHLREAVGTGAKSKD